MKNKLFLLLVAITFVCCNIKNTNKDSETSAESIQKKEAETMNKSIDYGNFITSIEVSIKATEQEVKDYGEETISWISIENYDKEIDRLIEPDKIVISEKEVTLLIDYPLNKPATFILISNTNGFTKKQLVQEISKKYHEIYNEEEKTATTKTVPLEKRKGIINRNETDGKYGIWGHDIGDLVLSSIEVYQTKDGKIQLVLGIES